MWHLLLLVAVAVAVAGSIGFATKRFLNKLNKTMDETAKRCYELLQNLDSIGNGVTNSCKISGRNEVMLKNANSEVRDIDVKTWSQLEAELEFELQKLFGCTTDGPCDEKINEFEAPGEGYHESDDWNSNYSKSHGVSASELHQKLSHLLIKQQENRIMELESELHQAQSNLHEKEADLEGLKNCVKRLLELSLLSTVSAVKPTEKFPPPLMRFLRNNAASRSRGRSRSTTTMFFRKKNKTNIETQEPSSPKVTCMGQVRVKRSVAKRVPSAAKRVPSAGAGAPTSEASSPKIELNFRVRSNLNSDEPERENRVTPRAFVPNTSTTRPRNPLLFTQCRSAPGRRFLNEETEVENRVNREEQSENNRDPRLEAKLWFF